MDVFHYLKWHYSIAYKDIVRIWLNYLWFIQHFFSITILFKTLLQPFKKLDDKSKTGFNLEALAQKLVVNLISRLVGIFVRTAIILLGVGFLLLAFLIGVVTLLIWTTLPLAIIAILVLTIINITV